MDDKKELNCITSNFQSDLKSPNLVKMMSEVNNNNSVNSTSCFATNKYKGIFRFSGIEMTKYVVHNHFYLLVSLEISNRKTM